MGYSETQIHISATRCFVRIETLPPPWTVEAIPGGFKVRDANGQSLAYVYGRETKADEGADA